MIPVVHTKRLTLRAPTWDDFEEYAAFRASPRLKIVGGPFNRREAFQQMCAIIGHWELRGFGRWMVTDKATDAPVGVVGLYHPEGWPEPELAWSVFDAAEGKGIAAEASRAARAYAYDTLGWTSLISAVHPPNDRAVALAKRLGCVEKGTLDHPDYGHLRVWHHPAPQDLP